MKKDLMKILIIKNEVFDFNVEWILTEDIQEAIDYVENKAWIILWDILHAQWFTSYEGSSVSYLYLKDRSDYILLHECIHIVQGVLARKWIDTGYENTEVLAYNVDWLYRKLLHAYYKHKKNKKYKNYE